MSSIARRHPISRFAIVAALSVTTAALLVVILFLTLTPTTQSAVEPAAPPAPTATAVDPGCLRMRGPC
jgi:hypothetical protein